MVWGLVHAQLCGGLAKEQARYRSGKGQAGAAHRRFCSRSVFIRKPGMPRAYRPRSRQRRKSHPLLEPVSSGT